MHEREDPTQGEDHSRDQAGDRLPDRSGPRPRARDRKPHVAKRTARGEGAGVLGNCLSFISRGRARGKPASYAGLAARRDPRVRRRSRGTLRPRSELGQTSESKPAIRVSSGISRPLY